jgi:hypothetical protein
MRLVGTSVAWLTAAGSGMGEAAGTPALSLCRLGP